VTEVFSFMLVNHFFYHKPISILCFQHFCVKSKQKLSGTCFWWICALDCCNLFTGWIV